MGNISFRVRKIDRKKESKKGKRKTYKIELDDEDTVKINSFDVPFLDFSVTFVG